MWLGGHHVGHLVIGPHSSLLLLLRLFGFSGFSRVSAVNRVSMVTVGVSVSIRI